MTGPFHWKSSLRNSEVSDGLLPHLKSGDDPGQTLRFAAFGQGLHYLSIPPKKETTLIWVNPYPH